MEKAFDRVNHKLLINKFKTYGFTEPLLSWFYSFISGRTQIVKYKNYVSEQILVTSGVPQGDHLSPILFCLFINDSSDVISHSKILLLADDAKIFKNISCTKDAIELQLDLNNMYKWYALKFKKMVLYYIFFKKTTYSVKLFVG